MKIITKNSDETKKIGLDLAEKIKPGDVLLLYGELGAGKTTFTKGLAEGLGIKDRILSPTFVLQRIHEVNKGKINKLNHIDLYRIEEAVEIKSLGLAEIFEDKKSVSVVEWADRLKDFKQKRGYKVHFKYLSDEEREVEIKKI